MNVTWRYCSTIRQKEVECGPRTIMNLCDIINRLQEGKAIPKIMQDISKYDINDVVLSQQSRVWMHRAVSDTLPLLFMF